jgi:hypothetical protein
MGCCRINTTKTKQGQNKRQFKKKIVYLWGAIY